MHRRSEGTAVARQRKVEIQEYTIRAQPCDTSSSALRPRTVQENAGYALNMAAPVAPAATGTHNLHQQSHVKSSITSEPATGKSIATCAIGLPNSDQSRCSNTRRQVSDLYRQRVQRRQHASNAKLQIFDSDWRFGRVTIWFGE